MNIALIFCFVLMMINASAVSANSTDEIDIENEIPIRDKTYLLIQKRKKEAEALFFEGVELKKKGYQENNEEFTAEGNLKRKMGEEQLQYLKEQEVKHKNRDEVYVR